MKEIRNGANSEVDKFSPWQDKIKMLTAAKVNNTHIDRQKSQCVTALLSAG